MASGAIVTYTFIDSGLISAYKQGVVAIGRGTAKHQNNDSTHYKNTCIRAQQDVVMSLDFDSARQPNPHFTEEHHAWREALRRFIDSEVMPYADEWDEAGEIPIELWPKAAAVGLLGLGYPEQFGGTPADSWHLDC